MIVVFSVSVIVVVTFEFVGEETVFTEHFIRIFKRSETVVFCTGSPFEGFGCDIVVSLSDNVSVDLGEYETIGDCSRFVTDEFIDIVPVVDRAPVSDRLEVFCGEELEPLNFLVISFRIVFDSGVVAVFLRNDESTVVSVEFPVCSGRETCFVDRSAPFDRKGEVFKFVIRYAASRICSEREVTSFVPRSVGVRNENRECFACRRVFARNDVVVSRDRISNDRGFVDVNDFVGVKSGEFVPNAVSNEPILGDFPFYDFTFA